MDIGEFYNFSEDEEEEEQVNGGVNLDVKRAVKTMVHGEDGENIVMEDDEGWESDSTLSSVPTDDIGLVPMDNQDTKHAKPTSTATTRTLILDFTGIPTASTRMPITDGQQSTTTDTNSIFLRDAQPVIAVYANTTSRTQPTLRRRTRRTARTIEAGRHDSDADDEEVADNNRNVCGRDPQVVT
ncbi:pre-60S factor rei1 [Elasticomyces elasticus]|nr:pre-60S factor rei1 [Elasticomyces elasticus]KAK4906468.1 pre-60S factor rei1 [Elasticomyces elasticus]KAK5745083.1 pre-60S factor rei1 [Elasticomyces elasticus]